MLNVDLVTYCPECGNKSLIPFTGGCACSCGYSESSMELLKKFSGKLSFAIWCNECEVTPLTIKDQESGNH